MVGYTNPFGYAQGRLIAHTVYCFSVCNTCMCSYKKNCIPYELT